MIGVGWAVVDESDNEMGSDMLHCDAVKLRDELEALWPDVVYFIVPADRSMR